MEIFCVNSCFFATRILFLQIVSNILFYVGKLFYRFHVGHAWLLAACQYRKRLEYIVLEYENVCQNQIGLVMLYAACRG